MAKYEKTLIGNFNEFLQYIDSEIINGSSSAKLEDGDDIAYNDVKCAVRVYERFSYIGSNRVSLNLTLFGTDQKFHITGITAGGSQAVFFKINTIGEESFLEELQKAVNKYEIKQSR